MCVCDALCSQNNSKQLKCDRDSQKVDTTPSTQEEKNELLESKRKVQLQAHALCDKRIKSINHHKIAYKTSND